MIDKISVFFRVYRWRKVVLLLNILLSIIASILLVVFMFNFQKYEEGEKSFSETNFSHASQQMNLFITTNSIVIVLFVLIALVSLFGFISLALEKNTAWLFLRINTYISFLIIISMVLILSIKPRETFKEIEYSNGFIGIEFFKIISYAPAWTSLIFSVCIAIFNAISRNNYGYLKTSNKTLIVNKK